MFGETERQVFTSVSIAFNSLSFCSCIWLFYLYTKTSSPRSAQFKMLVNLTLADFLIAVTGFITHFSTKTDTTCSINVFLSIVGYWSSAFWASMVAIFSYKKVALSREFNSNHFFSRAMFLWALLCVTVPLLPLFRLFGVEYKAQEDFCAISFSASPFVLFLATEGIPFISAIAITAISYVKQIQALQDLPDTFLSMINVKASKLSWYPIAQCLVFIPGLVCQFIFIVMPYESVVLHSIRLYGFRLAGFVNSLVYGLQRVRLGKSQAFLAGSPTRTESLLTTQYEKFYEEEESEKETMDDDGICIKM